MPDPVCDPLYWAQRLREAPSEALHHAVFICGKDRWDKVAEKHRQILARLVGPTDNVLDVGCGWGRLLDLLPPLWKGFYLGLDVSPDFIAKARLNYPKRVFLCRDLRNQTSLAPFANLAVCISVRGMVIRHMGQEEWNKMEKEILRLSKRVLYLEYDENSEGYFE